MAEALARATDPETSHEAARAVKATTKREQYAFLLARLGATGGSTDEELYRHAYSRGLRYSPSGLRTRRAELVAAGALVDTGGRRKLSTGRRAIVWGLPEDGADRG